MQLGIFTEETHLEKLSELGDSLEKLNIINWEIFRPILKDAFNKERKGSGARPAYDYLLLFKILILQRFFALWDDQSAYQINDRMSFMRFLGLLYFPRFIYPDGLRKHALVILKSLHLSSPRI